MKNIYFIAFAVGLLLSANNSFSQTTQPNTTSITLKYLSREAISDTYLDENGNRNTVWNSKEDAINFIKEKCEEANKASATSTPDMKLIPNSVYIWKSRGEDPNGSREEVLRVDVKNVKVMAK